MSDYWCALVIRGLGDDSGAYAFCLGDPALAPSGHQGVPLLTNYPQALSARLDPIKVEYDLSGFTFSIAAETPWLSLFARRIYFAEGALITAVDADDTTLEIAYTGAFSAGDYVYLGRETIKLGTLSSSSSYVDPATDQTVSYDVFTGCTRGALGSFAEPHYVSGEDDNRVYAYPELSGRLVEFWELAEGAEAPIVIWRGQLLDIRIEDEDESTILVDTGALLGLLSTRKLNLTPYAADTTTDVISVAQGARPGWVNFYSKLDEETIAARRRFGKTSQPQGSTTRLALQVAGCLTTGRISEITGESEDGTWYGYTTTDSLGEHSYQELGSVADGSDEGSYARQASGSKIYEVLCFGQDFVNAYGYYYGCGRNTTNRHHPLHLLLLILLSTGRGTNHLDWDWLGSSWGLGVPASLVDVAGIEAEMARTPDLMIDRLVLGWDGKDFSMRDVLDRTLRPLGYYLKDGALISVGRIEPLNEFTAFEIDQEHLIDMSERLERNMGSATQKIRASFGVPWGEQSTLSFENRGKQARLWWPESDSVGADFDLTAFAAPDNYGKSAASTYLAWVLQLMWRPIPTQRLRVRGQGSDDLWPGKQVALVSRSWPINSDGSRGVLVGEDGQRTPDSIWGLIVESEYSAQDACWTLALWLQNEPLRGLVVQIPPGVEVTSYNAATGELVIPRTSQGVDLTSYVTVGTVWMLCDKYLVPRAWAAPLTYCTVASVVVGTSTLTLLFSEGPSSAAPIAGDCLRWAEYTEQGANKLYWLYGANDTPRLGVTDSPKWYV